MKRRFWLRKGILFFVFFVAAIFLFSFAVMGLWNAFLPSVIGVKAINFTQALGILLLSKILFGGMPGGWGGRHRRGQWMDMQEKFTSMTPEEKEKFKAEWRNRCGGRWSRMDRVSTETTAL